MYIVNVEGLQGDNRIFDFEKMNNRKDSFEYANKLKERLNGMRMRNKITVTVCTMVEKTLILEL